MWEKSYPFNSFVIFFMSFMLLIGKLWSITTNANQKKRLQKINVAVLTYFYFVRKSKLK